MFWNCFVSVSFQLRGQLYDLYRNRGDGHFHGTARVISLYKNVCNADSLPDRFPIFRYIVLFQSFPAPAVSYVGTCRGLSAH